MVIVAVIALWGAAAATLTRQAAEREDAQLEAAVAVARGAVEDEAQLLVREATGLASDARVVEGIVRGDWAALARSASPRMLALSVERGADLLMLVDSAGTTLLQVPTLPRVTIPDLAPSATATSAVRVLDGRAWLLGLAPVRWQADTTIAVVVVGRRLEQLERRLARVPGHPVVVALAGDRLLGATRESVPSAGWLEAAQSGRLEIDAAPWRVRPLGGPGALWAAVPASDLRRELWLGLLAVLGVALAGVLAAAWIVARPRRTPGRLALRREVETLYAVAHSAARNAGASATVGELIAVACDVARVPAGVVLQRVGDGLTPVAERGMTAAELAQLARPAAASHAGEAIRTGRIVVTDLRRSALLDAESREVARDAGRRLQITLPVVVDGVTRGALLLLSGARHGPGEAELRLLGTVAQQIGVTMERARLAAAARDSGRRLDTLARVGRPLSAARSLEEFLHGVVDAAIEVSGASEARVWLVDADSATVELAAHSPADAGEAGQRRLAAGEGLVGAVIAAREPVVIADLATDPRVRNVERVRSAGLTSFAGLPLLLGDRVLGALTVATRGRHEFAAAELGLLQSLAGHAADALDSARRLAEATRSREQLGALLEINKRIAAAESSEALLRSIAEEAARLLEVDNAGFRLVDGDELVIAGLAGTAVETMLRPRIRIGESFSGRVVSEGRTMVAAAANVVDLIAEHREADERLGYTHFLGVPLRAGERIIGVLAFRARRRFTERDVALAEAFAGQAALALEHARLYRDASRHAERMAALADVEHLLTETLDADVVATRIGDSLRVLVQANAAGVYRLDADGGMLVALSVSGPVGPPVPWNRRLPAGYGAVGLAVRDRRPIVTTDLLTDPRIIFTPEARQTVESGVHRAVIAMPLLVRDRVIGGIVVADREGRIFDAEDVRLVQAFANQAAVALENARLFGEAARHAERMAALADVERLLSEALDPDVVAQRIADSVRSLLGARSAALYGIEPVSGDLTAVTASRDTETGFAWASRLPAGHGVVGLAITGRQPAVTADAPADLRLAGEGGVGPAGAAAAHRALLAVPLLAGDRVLGVLAVGDETGRVFGAEEVRLARAFADQAAVALENARLFALESTRRSHVDSLAAVERELAAELDRERLLRLIIDRASRLFAGFGTIYLVGDNDHLIRTAWAGEPVGDREIPFGAGISGACAATRQGTKTDDYPCSPAPLPAFVEVGTSRVMAQPLLARDRLLGVISMSRRGPDALPFSADDLAVLESFANQTAIALENARLHAEAQRGRDEARELARVARTLTESLEVSAVGARIVDSVLSLLPCRSAGVRLVDADGDLAVIAWRDPEGMAFPTGDVQPAGTGLAGRALAEGQAMWSADVLEDPDAKLPEAMRERIADRGHHAVLAVPLSAKGRTIGVLLVADTVVRTFSESEVALARAFGDQAALALDNARLHEEAERRRREAEVLGDLARTINASLDLGVVLQHITNGAHELCAGDLARIALREPDSEDFAYRYWVGARYDAYDRYRIQAGYGASGLVIDTGEPFRTDDYATDPRIRRLAADPVRTEALVTGLVVPIRIDDRVEGLLAVNRRTRRRFTDRDEAILVQLADHAAIAIRNARLYENVETRAARLRTLADVNRVVSSSLDTGEVLHAIARAASELMGQAFVAFWVADEGARTLTFSAVADPGVVADPAIATLAFGEGIVGQAAVERRTVDVPDVSASERFRAPEWARANGLVGFRAVPILLQGVLLGVLALGVRRPLRFDDADEALLDSFVAQAAVALDHARRYADTRRRLEETRALLEVAEILNGTLDPRRLLARATTKIAQVCGVDRCMLELWDGDQMTPLMAQFADGHRDQEMWDAFLALRPYAPRDVPAQLRALETRRPVVIEDATTTDQLPRDWVEVFRPKSYLAVPLIRQDQVMGLLTLDYTERVTRFEDWQLARANAIASQLVLALENSRLYAEAQERLRETSTLLAVGQALSEPAPVEESMGRMARELARAIGADVAAVCVLDDTGAMLLPLAGYHVPPALRDLFELEPVVLAGARFVREAIDAGAVVWSADPSADPRLSAEWAARLPAHSVLFAPTRVRGTTNGGLFLVWTHPGRVVEPAEVRLVEGVAGQVGLALDNAALARQREERLRETEMLLAVSRALSSTLDLDALLRQFMRQIAGAVGADTVGVWLLDAGGEWMAPIAGYRVPRVAEARALRLSVIEHPFYAEAVRRGQPVFAIDTATDPRIPGHLLETFPHRSQLFVPVRAQERMIGGFMAVWWEQPRSFTDRDFALIDAIASQAGAAIENARLFQQNRRQVEELSVLHELSRAVTGQLDRQALLGTIRANVQRGLDAQKIVVLLADDASDEFDVAMRVVDGGEDPLPRRCARSTGLASLVMETGQTLRTEDYAAECVRRGIALLPATAPRHWIGAPMRAGDGMLGVLAASREDRPFTDGDERLLGHIADLAALALRSAWLYEERTRAYGELAAAQDQLVRTEKLRALGEMASGVAHDFNNLLAAILGRTQLLLRQVQDPKLRRWLEIVERSALDGAQTVRRLQDFARVRRDQPKVLVDLRDVIVDALEMTQSRWHEESLGRGIALDVRRRLQEVPAVAGDPAELREAMTNLILNALDAMPGGGTLTLTTRVFDRRVEIVVQDTGVGIAPDVRDKIFDPFFTTKGPQGTGLGLSMTYGIVARHGGSVTVESEPGRGTAFRLSFPPAHGVDAPADADASPVIAPLVLRCLVVDDEETVGAVLGDTIEALGHRAVVVHDGRSAVELVRTERFDVVFTDLAMPGVSGWQVASAVKASAPDVPVFLVTGFGVEVSPEEQKANGVDGLYAKPLGIEDMMNALALVAKSRTAHFPEDA